jgi:hypothetical protein
MKITNNECDVLDKKAGRRKQRLGYVTSSLFLTLCGLLGVYHYESDWDIMAKFGILIILILGIYHLFCALFKPDKM